MFEIKIEDEWHDCPFYTCSGKRVKITNSGLLDVVVRHDEIIYVYRVPEISDIIEAAELAYTAIDAVRYHKKGPWSYREELEELLEKIIRAERLIRAREEAPFLWPYMPRVVCWDMEFYVEDNVTKKLIFKEKKRFCRRTIYSELVVPMRKVKRFSRWREYDSWKERFETWCGWAWFEEDWRVVRSIPANKYPGDPWKLVENMHYRATERAAEEALRVIRMFRQNLMDFLRGA